MSTLRTAYEAQHRPIAELACKTFMQMRDTLEGKGDMNEAITVPLLGTIRLRKLTPPDHEGIAPRAQLNQNAAADSQSAQQPESVPEGTPGYGHFVDSQLPSSSMFDAELILGPYNDLDNIWEMFEMM